ncbi:hypothetical protein Javan64_0054 [Streptococcus phage Javan64]|nr:hypothetical protein Javan64_0054 [Streptococcus phage Javan64]
MTLTTCERFAKIATTNVMDAIKSNLKASMMSFLVGNLSIL